MRADAQRNRQLILRAAEEVFAAHGPQASTEEVARRAGVAIGTVFRHFPTKADLLTALLKDLLRQLTADAERLAGQGDPATALTEFFTGLVERTSRNRSVVDLLAVSLDEPIESLAGVMEVLLRRGQEAGAIRSSVRLDEVMALLVAACHGALHGAWSASLRSRTVALMLAGLRA
jgi:AcrR family transcriptional regulator